MDFGHRHHVGPDRFEMLQVAFRAGGARAVELVTGAHMDRRPVERGAFAECRSGPRKVARATSPASRTAATSRALCATRSISLTANGQSFHPQGRRIGAETEFEIVGRRQRAEDLVEMSGDRHFADRIALLALFDPEPG